TAGRVLQSLASIGVAPGDIDTIAMTHMHPDHEAGLTDAGGASVFTNAELVAHADEIKFWTDDGEMARARPSVEADFHRARKALAAYKGRVRTVRENEEVVPGIRAVS